MHPVSQGPLISGILADCIADPSRSIMYALFLEDFGSAATRDTVTVTVMRLAHAVGLAAQAQD